MSDLPPNTPSVPELPSAGQQSVQTPSDAPARAARPGRVWTPSPRLTAALAAAMLAIGVAVGAAIGPAPDASFAGASQFPALLQSLLAGSKRAAAPTAAAAALTQEASAPAHRRRRRRVAAAAAASESAGTEPASAAEEGSGSSSKKGSGESAKAKPLPPVTKVWVVQLNGTGFEEAFAAPTSAPYIDTQAIPSGSYLNSWSSLAGTTFASDAALISTTEPHLAQTITQPPCPEGAAGAACAPGTPGAIAAADAFLKQTLTTLTASAAYRSSGLIVVTFATVASGASSELPAGSTTATLASGPSGALLISPFVTKAARPTTTFNPASPRQSLEALLHR